MRIRDVMNTNVVTIPSTTSLAEARRIMDTHNITRLPVVDKGKLAGIVSQRSLDKAGPSELTTFSIHELNYLLSKLTVREVMRRDVVTVSPEMTCEEGVALAQNRRVGALIVIENGHLVGIATTNDFFYKILNPVLGIGDPGTRIHIHNCPKTEDVEKVLAAIGSSGTGIITMFTMKHPEEDGIRDLVVHLDTDDPSKVIDEVQKLGYEVEERAR